MTITMCLIFPRNSATVDGGRAAGGGAAGDATTDGVVLPAVASV
jgi:hypothetical protein